MEETVTPETARFLLSLIDQQTVSIGHPDAEQITTAMFTARRELLTVIEPND